MASGATNRLPAGMARALAAIGVCCAFFATLAPAQVQRGDKVPKVRCGKGFADIVGTEGSDKIRLKGRKRHVVATLGGRDLIIGAGGDDVICAGRGPDRIFGGAGDDRINGGAGNDRIVGGMGNDRIASGAGLDSVTPKRQSPGFGRAICIYGRSLGAA